MNPRRPFVPLFLLFIGSGCAALIYEVVWFQLLELVIGSSAVSMGVLLGTFMGGMCLGSLLWPRVAPARLHPLRAYAWLELGIGAIGLLVLFGMPLVAGAYAAWGGSGVGGILWRGVAAGLCLLPPTFLMGATLPAVARWVESSPEGVSWLGFFYGGNTAGAVIGSLLAGFYLLRIFDVAVATFVAVAINVAVAVVALILASLFAYERTAEQPATGGRAPGARTIYVAIALSGFTALASEVIWTRLLSLLLGATTYTFSLILAVFLAGIGIGSSIASLMTARLPNPRVGFAWCQLALCGALAWSAYMLTESLPFWPVSPSLSTGPWFQFQLDLVRCAVAVLPAAVLWGASFPLALSSLAVRNEDSGRLVGGLYSANTLGAIVGALGASMILVVWIGTQHAQQLLIAISALSGLLVLAGGASLITRLGFALMALLLAGTVQPVPGALVAFGRYTASEFGQADIIYVGEGWNASVAVSDRANGVRNYHNAGKVQASSEPQDMRLQRMLGHLTTLVPAHPKSVLVIGCGAGVTAGAVSIDPAVERETIAEIEPLVPQVVSSYFSSYNFDVVANPKVTFRIDDGRHFLLTTTETFDAITSDPLDPWVKGAAMLYTREFFDLLKRRLNPGGVVTLFVQLYESNLAAVKSEVATFFEAFPHGMIFANLYAGQGYDLVLLGQVEPARIDLDAIQTRLGRPEYARVVRSMNEIGMKSAVDLFATYAGSATDFAPWLRDAQINQDRNLRLQYLAGRGLNLYEAGAIFTEMRPYASEPGGTIIGSADQMAELQQKIRVFLGR